MEDTIKNLLVPGKGILAADESTNTITKRFASIGLTSSPELNKKYRELLFNTPEIENHISGVILFSESIEQGLQNLLVQKRIIPGVKVDGGLEPFNDSLEQVTKGLGELSERLKSYSEIGLKFTKWRGVVKITDILPTDLFLEENMGRMADYAKMSQDNNLVPIVEPEVLIEGNHTTTRCAEIETKVLQVLYKKLLERGADLSKTLLKTSFVLPGKDSGVIAEPLEVANATLRVLRLAVPAQVPGILFLSGGQNSWDAIANLDKIVDLSKNDPWQISFSYSRALQEEPMEVWAGKDENIDEAQVVFLGKLKEAGLAREGKL